MNTSSFASGRPALSWHAGLLLGLALLLGAATARAQSSVQQAVNETTAVQGIATAARLCNQISDVELSRAAERISRMHAQHMNLSEQEAYLAQRGTETFRSAVQAVAARRTQGGCGRELFATWRDLDATLAAAEIQTATR